MFKNFKMTFDYRYIVNDGAIICFAAPRHLDAELTRMTANYIRDKGHKPKNTIAPEYKGIARYKEGDIDDPETATEIARCKAVRAAFKGYAALTNELLEYIYEKYGDFFGVATSIDNKIDKITEEIIEMTKQ